MYFSDHGEEVYDSRQYFSHQESDATTFMFDIPFIIWCSEGYKKENAKKVDYLSHQTHRPYQTDDVIHSILDLSNIKASRWDPTKSIFNPKFIPEKRSMNNQDYDSIKKDFEIYHQAILKRNK
jgi:heptose-I-phosphate ethanolaminephosphotransferase